MRFNCPECGVDMTVPDEYAGKQGKCRACGTQITVPDLSASPDSSGASADWSMIEDGGRTAPAGTTARKWEPGTCWFCGRPATGQHNMYVMMQNNRHQRSTYDISNVLMRTGEVERCSRCRSAHMWQKYFPVATALVGALIGAVIGMIIAGAITFTGTLLVIALFLGLVGYVVGAVAYKPPQGVKPRNFVVEYPEVKMHLKRGFHITEYN